MPSSTSSASNKLFRFGTTIAGMFGGTSLAETKPTNSTTVKSFTVNEVSMETSLCYGLEHFYTSTNIATLPVNDRLSQVARFVIKYLVLLWYR